MTTVRLSKFSYLSIRAHKFLCGFPGLLIGTDCFFQFPGAFLRRRQPLFLLRNVADLLYCLCFLNRPHKLGAIILGIFCNRPEHIRNKRQNRAFIDKVLCGAASPQPAHILDDDSLHPASHDFLHHGNKAETVKASAGDFIVCEVGRIGKAISSGIVLQHGFLVGNAVAFALQFIVTGKSIV